MTHADLLDQKSHFAFGENWLAYAEKINDERIAQACADLQRLGGRSSLAGQSFLDIGCGSGLHALAASRLGAARIVATDIDPDSVSAARRTLSRFAPGAQRDVEVCSVFDMTPERTGSFDIVYSWGVLHHTGDMRAAIGKAADLVAPGGEFWLALYEKTALCGMWRRIKRWYSGASAPKQAKARAVYITTMKGYMRLRGLDFAELAKGRRARGMDFHHDVHDWLGGYPYESITPDDCRALLASLGFKLEREFPAQRGRFAIGLFGSGCAEYAFRRRAPA